MENDFSKIAEQLKKYKTVQGIMKFVNEETIIKQHTKQARNKATGIDGIRKEDYEENLNGNVRDLVNSMKTMSYRPKEVRRTYIPKTGSKELRPLGIPTYEDKLVQGAMADILNAIYENIFLDCSYGFRPNRDCHKAIKKLDEIIMSCYMETILIEAKRMGRSIHLSADVVIQTGKCLDQFRFFLDTGLICVRNIIGKRPDYCSSGGGTLLNFPLLNPEQFSDIITNFSTLRNLGKLAKREKKPLRDLAAKSHSAQPKTFAHDIGLFVAGCTHELKLLPDGEKAVDFKIYSDIKGFELVFVYNALPAKYMRKFNAIRAFNRLDLPDPLDTCEFSHCITSMTILLGYCTVCSRASIDSDHKL